MRTDSIDLVFANAGVGAGEGGPMWTYSMNDWQWCFNVNVWGVVNTINAFMPAPDRTGTGSAFRDHGFG